MWGNLLFLKDLLELVTSVSKNMYIDNLADIIDKYNNAYHSTIKMKPSDVNSNTHLDFHKENKKEDPEFGVVYHVRISKYKNIFARLHSNLA